MDLKESLFGLKVASLQLRDVKVAVARSDKHRKGPNENAIPHSCSVFFIVGDTRYLSASNSDPFSPESLHHNARRHDLGGNLCVDHSPR